MGTSCEALAAVRRLTNGFVVHLFTDKKTNLFTNSLPSNCRGVLDIEELGLPERSPFWGIGDGPSRP